MPQLNLPLGPIATNIPQTLMPPAKLLARNASKVLDTAIARQLNGSLRSACSGSPLPAYVSSGKVRIEDVYLPFRPELSNLMVDDLLWQEKHRIETGEHRLLKAHARILARSLDPHCLLEPEARLPGGSLGRADLLSWSTYGLPTVFEAGATDGRSVLRFLEEGVLRVIILPFVGLDGPGIRGYSFSWAKTPKLPPLSYRQGETAFTELIEPFFQPFAA